MTKPKPAAKRPARATSAAIAVGSVVYCLGESDTEFLVDGFLDDGATAALNRKSDGAYHGNESLRRLSTKRPEFLVWHGAP